MQKMRMCVLGVETSCDETGIAVYDSEAGLLGHDLYSQGDMHSYYGGVVPELASRDHLKRLIPLVKTVLLQSGLTLEDITGIAYTAGPGLIGALLTGASFAHSLAWSLGIPAVAVNHMEGHLLAPLLDTPTLSPPFVALLVSGGHTELVHVKAIGSYEVIGDTLDDAAGEAFDKTAKLMGLGYPGGARLSAIAKKGHANRFYFPRPMTDRPGLDFSFSGLKTAVLTIYQKTSPKDEQLIADIAIAFEEAMIDTLVIKCKRAIQKTGLTQLVVAGGVSANTVLREQLKLLMHKEKGEVYFPRPDFCTDNGAMIAFAGCLRLKAGQKEDLAIKARARWPIEDVPPVSTG